MQWGYTLSGLLVGFIVGLTGVGGGSLMTPLLVVVFGINPASAVGTDLLYAAITKTGGGWVHAKHGKVDWKIAKLLALGSIPAALSSILLIRTLAINTQQLASLITVTLGVALILTAAALIFREPIRRLGAGNAWSKKSLERATVVTGAALGVLVTLSSVGAGAIGTVALYFLYPELSAARIVGTDIVHAVPLTATAGLGHAALGTVDFSLLWSLLAGSLPGIYFGSHLAARVPEKLLRGILASMLILIGGKLVW